MLLVGLLTSSPIGMMDGSADFYKLSASTLLPDGVTPQNLTITTVRGDHAVCLDGSQAAFYFRPGSGTGAKKWHIHHQGGGWCESLDDCLQRSTTALGTSKNYTDTMTQETGYFSENPDQNPMMYNWNTVYMPYCDGASFSGNNASTTVHNGTALHFRGWHIRKAIQASLLAGTMANPAPAKLSDATDVVIGGCSAGGLATYLHTDQWCDAVHAVNAQAKCVGLPDSGFFIDYQNPTVPAQPPVAAAERLGNTIAGNYHAGLKWAHDIQNASAGINVDCVAAHQSTHDDWKCMFAEHTAPFIHTPIFAMQSEYDSWQIHHVLLTRHTKDPDSIQTLGDNITARITADLFPPHPSSGSFLDSCQHHCGFWNNIRIDGDYVAAAFTKWYNGIGVAGSKTVWKQGKPYPCADCCRMP